MSSDHEQPAGSALFERCVTRRSMLAATGGVVTSALLGCGGDDSGSAGGKPKAYFGYLLGSEAFAAVAFDVSEGSGNRRTVKAYVCDGLGPPEGLAVWFTGSVDQNAVNRVGRIARLASASGGETLGIGAFTDMEIRGTFTDAKDSTARYITYPVRDGAGIYEVTVDEKLNYRGSATDGSSLEGRTDAQGNVRGTVKPAGGGEISFFAQNNALASEVRLASLGVSPKSRRYARNSRVPGQYVAVISPGATHWFGRSGNVRSGSPGAAIIGLDKSD